jgi:Sortilin, neurotensin receptor 3,
MSERPFWGNILKSNSNGTYYGLSMEYANRDGRGLVDFEKMIGLDGIALINIVANPDEAKVTNEKKLQSRITHNDGKFWFTCEVSSRVDPGCRRYMESTRTTYP